ncbi:hypothetical protein N7454_010204 [Penicillium verhagenii]|nr:hypothetical protein N7454_010204 [Penicillium verhagenii]
MPTKRKRKTGETQENERWAYGDIMDGTRRHILDINKLGLGFTWVGAEPPEPLEDEEELPKPTKPERKRWQHSGREPLIDYS